MNKSQARAKSKPAIKKAESKPAQGKSKAAPASKPISDRGKSSSKDVKAVKQVTKKRSRKEFEDELEEKVPQPKVSDKRRRKQSEESQSTIVQYFPTKKNVLQKKVEVKAVSKEDEGSNTKNSSAKMQKTKTQNQPQKKEQSSGKSQKAQIIISQTVSEVSDQPSIREQRRLKREQAASLQNSGQQQADPIITRKESEKEIAEEAKKNARGRTRAQTSKAKSRRSKTIPAESQADVNPPKDQERPPSKNSKKISNRLIEVEIPESVVFPDTIVLPQSKQKVTKGRGKRKGKSVDEPVTREVKVVYSDNKLHMACLKPGFARKVKSQEEAEERKELAESVRAFLADNCDIKKNWDAMKKRKKRIIGQLKESEIIYDIGMAYKKERRAVFKLRTQFREDEKLDIE